MCHVRGSAGIAMLIAVALLYLLVHSAPVHAEEFIVGDERGWTFHMASWPKGKSFNIRDELVFKYSPDLHNVVRVDLNGYTSCEAPSDAEVHDSGNDRIALVEGTNSFICTFPGHCAEQGMRITLIADIL